VQRGESIPLFLDYLNCSSFLEEPIVALQCTYKGYPNAIVHLHDIFPAMNVKDLIHEFLRTEKSFTLRISHFDLQNTCSNVWEGLRGGVSQQERRNLESLAKVVGVSLEGYHPPEATELSKSRSYSPFHAQQDFSKQVGESCLINTVKNYL
jgi:hypothetical protein